MLAQTEVLPWDILGESFVNSFRQPKSLFVGDTYTRSYDIGATQKE